MGQQDRLTADTERAPARAQAMRSYALRIFISLKFITANVVDRNSGGIVASASTVEHSVKSAFEYGRSSSPKAAAVVGEVLAMRLKVVGLDHPELAECGIHADVHKEIKKKGLENSAKIWAVINALRYYGVKLIIDDAPDGPNKFVLHEQE